MPNKLKIAVSSCLLGEAVRYDGTDKNIELITNHLAAEYTLISICPEMAIGMGVPRPPIHLVDDGKCIQAIGVANEKNNVTNSLIHCANKTVESHSDICGYIFKKNSPSCGTKDVKVMTENGEYERRGQGIYAATIMNALPLLPVIDEKDCLNKEMMGSFLIEVDEYSKQLP